MKHYVYCMPYGRTSSKKIPRVSAPSGICAEFQAQFTSLSKRRNSGPNSRILNSWFNSKQPNRVSEFCTVGYFERILKREDFYVKYKMNTRHTCYFEKEGVISFRYQC
jgi:hypothetical protein